MSKKIFFSAVVLMMFSFQENYDVNETLKRVKEKYNKVNDYTATGKLKTNVIFIKAPVATVKVYYKKPDKIKIKNEKGVSLIPKGTVNININNVLGLTEFETFDGGTEKAGGKTCRTHPRRSDKPCLTKSPTQTACSGWTSPFWKCSHPNDDHRRPIS